MALHGMYTLFGPQNMDLLRRLLRNPCGHFSIKVGHQCITNTGNTAVDEQHTGYPSGLPAVRLEASLLHGAHMGQNGITRVYH